MSRIFKYLLAAVLVFSLSVISEVLSNAESRAEKGS
jgi:hypothetical protein